MDQQVSPAVEVIVLSLIVAILVGLYFLVVEREPQSAESVVDDTVMPPAGDDPVPDGEPAEVEEGAPGDTEADAPAAGSDLPAGEAEGAEQEPPPATDQPSDAEDE